MFFLVYVSSATRPFSREDLRVLLETCRKNNAELGVTGMLLYKDGNFMQVLEGDEGAVRGLYARIAADPRHGGEITLQQGFAEGRQFPDWSMGFRDLDSPEAHADQGYNEFLNAPLTGREFSGDPSRAQKLLITFKRTM
jgi:Sensors of blue-light using FAD